MSRWLKTLPDWRWLHTPGHTPGHVSLWRAADRTTIAGDAQESAYAVAVQEPEMHGPPMYYTTNWDNARSSVELLASLEPDRVITGRSCHAGSADARRTRSARREFRSCGRA